MPYQLEDDFRMHEIALNPQETIDLQINISTGFVPAGTYTGQIIIAGVIA